MLKELRRGKLRKFLGENFKYKGWVELEEII